MIERHYINDELELEFPEGVNTSNKTEEDANEDENDELIIEPFDPTLIRVATVISTADLLISRLRNKEIDLSPDFQRRAGIWSDTAQSRLIESMLIKIPLPAFYMDATDEDKWVVVDGLQRLTTLHRFVIDQSLKLTGMEFLNQLNGKTFDALPRVFQRRILETQVTVYQIEKGTPSGIKFNIFRRINTGGLPLSAQEIRHALYQGAVTELLKRLAESTEFKQATNNNIKPERMADREYVLRFLAFVLTPYDRYGSGGMNSFLNDAMKSINALSSQKHDELEARFRRAMKAAYRLFGPYAFRKRMGSSSSPIDMPLFEAWAVNLDKFSDGQLQELVECKSKVEEAFVHLLNDNEFNSAISLSTGTTRNVKLRFSRIEQLITQVLKVVK